ncbi:MAG: hypothetical protein Tsb004_29750 [Allomuricauda sp.]
MEHSIFNDIIFLLNAFGAGNCYVLSLVFARNYKKGFHGHGVWIAILLFIFGFVTTNTLVNESGYVDMLPSYEPLSNALGYYIAPVLFIMIRVFGDTLDKKAVKYHLLFPSFVLLMTLLIQFVLPDSWLRDMLSHLVEGTWFRFLWNGFFALYLFLAYRALPKRSHKNEDRLVLTLFWGIGVIWLINLVKVLLGRLMYPTPLFWDFNATILFFCLTLYIFYNALFFPNSKRRSSSKNVQVPLEGKKLSDGFDALVRQIKEQKLYRNPELNLRGLSDQLDISYTSLSQMINHETGVNFNDFINKLRVDEIVGCLESEAHKDYTIIGLAEQAGFRSPSSFYAAFRKVTGTTPTRFIEQSSKA